MIDLSIILLTYNNETHVEESILSVLKQEVDFSYNIVVGDDCSTDKTLEILNHYGTKYPNVFDIKQNGSQLGILKNFKTTLDRCAGRYVFNLAGDDLLSKPYALQKMVSALKQNNELGFVDSGFDKYYEDSSKTIHFSNKSVITASKQVYKEQLLLGRITPISICFNKEKIYEYVDFKKYINQNISIDDYPILVDLAMNSSFERIDDALHMYRIHNQSYSHNKSFEKQYFFKQQMKFLFDQFSQKYQFENSLSEKFLKHHNEELLFLCGYFEEKDIGKKVYNAMIYRRIKDYIHYWASQNKFFRKLISLF